MAHWVPTEQINPNTRDIDLLATAEILQRLNDEDQRVAIAVSETIPAITAVVDRVVDGIRRGGRLFYFGAGTSGRLGVLDAAECPPTYSTPPELVQGIIAGGDRALRIAVEGAEDSAELGRQDVESVGVRPQDVVIGISASGGAAYVVSAMEAARASGAYTAAITCHPSGKLALSVDQPIVVQVGPEAITGSTRMKAGTAQKLILNMISTATMVQLGKTYENLMVDVKPTNLKLRDRAARIVSSLGRVSYEEAEHLLGQANDQVKTAVVMARLQVPVDEAQRRLAAANGKLRRTIEEVS
jgi:N-acetylmuramic acid 6-phosphate etherase